MPNEYDVTTNEIMDFLKENMATKDDIKNMATKDDIKDMVTKQYLDEKLGKFRSDITDYMDRRLLDLKGDLVVIMKSEDRKLSALIELLVHKSILTTSEAHSIVKMEPFPQRV